MQVFHLEHFGVWAGGAVILRHFFPHAFPLPECGSPNFVLLQQEGDADRTRVFQGRGMMLSGRPLSAST